MTRLAVVIAASVLAGCALAATQEPAVTTRDLAGAWQGRLALQLANAAATLTIKEDGTYQGALHLDGGEDRPFSGAIVTVREGRLRYQGTHGNGLVMVRQRGEITLRFVPDGGGGGGAFTRAP